MGIPGALQALGKGRVRTDWNLRGCERGGQDEVPDRGTSGRDAHRSGIVDYSRSRRGQAAAGEPPLSAVSAGLRGVWYKRAMA